MEFNYPLDEIVLPMGGTTVKDPVKMDEIWDSIHYIAEEKYDGTRYLSVGGRFFSRKISVKTDYPVEKTENVPHLSQVFDKYPLLILDGEIYIKGATSNQVVSIMGAGREKALARQLERGNLQYMVYDILRDTEGNWLLDLPWIARREILEKHMERIFSDNLMPDDTISLSKYVLSNKKEFNAEIMLRNGEGVMLKNINGKYFPDKKPRWNWIKFKQEITSDVIITGFKPAKQEYAGDELDTWQYYQDEDGVKVQLHNLALANEMTQLTGKKLQPISKWYFNNWIGAIEFSQYNQMGELIPVGFCSGMNEELRKDISDNQTKYLNECMEISAMERTADDYFRHPQFLQMRPDKNQKDCIIGED